MSKMELLQGTLDMLVLRVLSGGPMHGWGIAQRIQILSKDVLQVEEGSIYPALYRMEHKGWIKAEYEGQGVVTMREGSAWLQPPKIKHTVLDYSDDCELLEIILPADFDTVELE